jgi:ABC-2 type transport system permease protein
MVDGAQERTAIVSHFRLLLWLKFRLIYMSYSRSMSKIISTILAVVVFVPISVSLAVGIFALSTSQPALTYFIDRDVLAAVFLFWIFTPLAGFSLNDSYDPTRLFVYPVRYQTIFAANVVGSMLEGSSILMLPPLVALLLSTSHTASAIVAGVVFLLLFMVLTIAAGQAVSLLFIGFLKSRRFRDIMIVFFPLLMLLRYFFYPRSGQDADFAAIVTSSSWKIAELLPPGWAAQAMMASAEGQWAKAFSYSFALVIGAALTIMFAALVLKQLFVGDRGTSLPSASAKIAEEKKEKTVERPAQDLKGMWLPIFAIVQKEYKYFVRDPQYKSLVVRMIYLIAAIGFSFFRTTQRTNHAGFELFSSFDAWKKLLLPLGLVGMVQFASASLPMNMFGGEGPAITVLFSFPIKRRYLVIGKNIAYGQIILMFSLIVICALSYLTHNLNEIPLCIAYLLMATPISIAVGNLMSIKFPYRMIVRGSRFTTGSSSTGAGCGYGLVFLLAELASFIVAIPAAACVILPGIDPSYNIWYTVSLPIGLLYGAGIYYLSLMIVDSWMIDQEQNIIGKLIAVE